MSKAGAQSPADWWYFGDKAGIHFESSGPVADTNGALITLEGCASISNSQGNLLFYTDGTYVFNSQHDTMPNGIGLFGSSSSTQSAIIVPKPGDISKFYVITAAINQYVGLNYSLVDMNLEGGLGDIDTSEKNIPLLTNTRENIAAVKHANGVDYWVLTHKYESDTMAAFKISSSGVNTTPVYTATGDSLMAYVGSLKGSPNGKLLVLANGYGNSGLDELKIMEFNNSTGEITNSTFIGSTLLVGAYGTEFSTNNKVLYVSDGFVGFANGRITQYDVSVFDSTLIASSEYIVADSVSWGQIQMGPDGKIYSTTSLGYEQGLDSFLQRINSPNTLGVGCDFELKAVYLGGRAGKMGLPPFVSSFFVASFDIINVCIGDSTKFTVDTALIDSMYWNFGDPNSGVSNTSNNFFPSHQFSDTGTYTITLIATRDTLSDTVIQQVYIYPRQFIDLGSDTTVCRGTLIEFLAKQPYASYEWHDNTTADSFLTTGDTFVKVTVFGVCDTASDSINIIYEDTITLDLGPDTMICGTIGHILNGNLTPPDATVWWNTNDSTATLVPTESGLFILFAENTCGLMSDTVEVSFISLPSDSLLPNDTINCFDIELVLTRPDEDSTTYIWSDSSSKKTYSVDTTEMVWLAAFNECGFSIDTINIIFNGAIISELGIDTTICTDDSIVLNAFSPGATYVWNTGDTIDTITTELESMLYIVTITQGLCTSIESKRVDLSEVFCPDLDCRFNTLNVFSPNGDGVNDLWRVHIDCDIIEYDLRIYNRWGQLVHQSSNSNFGWDGSINGIPASEGVYFFDINYKDNLALDVDRFEFKGSLTLVR